MSKIHSLTIDKFFITIMAFFIAILDLAQIDRTYHKVIKRTHWQWMPFLLPNESLVVDQYFNFFSFLSKRNLSMFSVSRHRSKGVPMSLDKSLFHAQTKAKCQVRSHPAPSRLCQYTRFFYHWSQALMLPWGGHFHFIPNGVLKKKV
jgi:hypothetical protein